MYPSLYLCPRREKKRDVVSRRFIFFVAQRTVKYPDKTALAEISAGLFRGNFLERRVSLSIGCLTDDARARARALVHHGALKLVVLPLPFPALFFIYIFFLL